MQVRARCHVCTAPVALSAAGPAPVVCPRPRCRTAIDREQLCDKALMNERGWLGAPSVARSTGLNTVVATRVLARLERRGWVESTPCGTASLRSARTRRAYRLTDPGVQVARLFADSAANTTPTAQVAR